MQDSCRDRQAEQKLWQPVKLSWIVFASLFLSGSASDFAFSFSSSSCVQERSTSKSSSSVPSCNKGKLETV